MNQRGFTLMEIMIVVAIIALIAGVVGVNIAGNLQEASITMARNQIETGFRTALQDYHRNCNFSYPTTEQGLQALIEKPSVGKDCPRYRPGGYLGGDSVPLDPWGIPYIYESNGINYKICSLGRDGLVGGSGPDEDICVESKN